MRQTADKPYQEALERELELLKERVRACARSRMESARREVEEEERTKRLGPGGLDPAEVYQSLPKVNALHKILSCTPRPAKNTTSVAQLLNNEVFQLLVTLKMIVGCMFHLNWRPKYRLQPIFSKGGHKKKKQTKKSIYYMFTTTQELQQSFDQKNVQMLQEAMGRLHPEVRLLSLSTPTK